MSENEIEVTDLDAQTEIGCDIEINAAREEATWYSVMNVLALSLGSGMGIPLDDVERNEAAGWAGMSWDDIMLKNPLPLKGIFKSGTPHLLKPFDQMDLDTWRWNPDSFDQALVPQAHGWTILAESQCAKWFGLSQTTEGLPCDMQDQWKALAMFFYTLARKQCDFAINTLRNDQGLFITSSELGSVRVTNEATNLEDQACMLWACSDLAIMAKQPNTIFTNDSSRECFITFSNQLFEDIWAAKDMLLDASLNKVLAQSIAIPALVWYSCVTDAQDLRARSLWMLRGFADNLVKAQDANEMVGDTLIDAAAALRALVEAFRVTRLRTYAETCVKIFDYIESQWSKTGVYAPTPLATEYTFNADDIGIILGALNSSRIYLKERVDRDLAELRMRTFFCKAVNMSGLQMSMPSMDFLPEWLQQREPELHFRYSLCPLPSEADIAPVFAGEVAYDPQSDTWSRNVIFDAPAAMHACCELLWLSEAINGFPQVELAEAPIVVRQAAGIEG